MYLCQCTSGQIEWLVSVGRGYGRSTDRSAGNGCIRSRRGSCRRLDVGIRINREGVERDEVIEFLDVVVLSVRQNVSGSIAKLGVETLGDAVELECLVELFSDYLFEDVAVQWQWLDRTMFALIIRTKWN